MTRLGAITVGAVAAAVIAACGGGMTGTTTVRAHAAGSAKPDRRGARDTSGKSSGVAPRHRAPAYPRLLKGATGSSITNFVPAVSWRRQTAAWVARRPGLALLSFNQSLLELRLHSGTVDAGAAGWRYGPAIAGVERRRLVAAFNGGFKLDTHSGGFESYGRVGSALSAGLGSIVTYSDGFTDIGAWRQGVPAPRKHVVSVRQNLHLLIAGGRPAADLGCLLCWGATLGGVTDPARSALGITADGRLIWAGEST